MPDQQEIRGLISRARDRGAIICVYNDPPYDDHGEGWISRVQVRSGIPSVGQGWMSLNVAAECLREFLAGCHGAK